MKNLLTARPPENWRKRGKAMQERQSKYVKSNQYAGYLGQIMIDSD
jgi:hypothetical protein